MRQFRNVNKCSFFFLQALTVKAREKFDITSDVKIVLESDGTEVDEEYFRFIEKNTCFMILKADEDWVSPFEYNQQIEKEKEAALAGPSKDKSTRKLLLIYKQLLS